MTKPTDIIEAPLSDELLNALIDGELVGEELRRVGDQVAADPQNGARLRRLQTLKTAVAAAYPPLPMTLPSPVPPFGTWRRVGLRAAAAVVLLCIGALAGWSLPPPAADRVALIDPAGTALRQVPADALRVVFHVNQPREDSAEELLDDIEWMLHDFQQSGQTLRIEVVANGDGLWLLRQGFSGYETRIYQLAQRYPNLTFVACQNTVERLQADGVTIALVPEAKVIPSGVVQVVRRLQRGWVYIQV